MDRYNISNSSTGQLNASSPGPVSPCLESPLCLGFHVACFVFGGIGIISNGMVLVTVGREKRLHTVTFVSISCLALADFVYVASRFARDTTKIWYRGSDDFIRNFTVVCDLFSVSGACASIFHVILLSVLRYFLVVHALKSYVLITLKKVKLVSFITWLVSFAIGSFYLYAVILNGRQYVQLAKVTNLTVTVVMSVLPIVLIGTLHVFKARTLLRSLATCRKSTVRRMSRIVTLIITAFVITTLPSSVADCIKIALLESDGRVVRREWLSVLQYVGRLGLYINFTINPFIYLLSSPQFRKALICQRFVYRPSESTARTESQEM